MLFRLSDVSKSFGGQEVLRLVNFQMNPGEHVGLVGRNGAGKTTLLRLISGVEQPDSGVIDRPRDLRFGVLDQEVNFSGQTSVLDAALGAFSLLAGLESRMRDLEHRMAVASGEALDRLLEQYSTAQHSYEHEGGFTYHARAEAALIGLGFEREDFGKQASNLSGGEKNRLGLARLLLTEPDILLLDEPTNHLDVEATEWLEDFLSGYGSAYIIISHDRFFLDHTALRVLELERGRVDSYKGNYSHYLVAREERRSQQQRAFEQQQELVSRTEEFIRRNLAGQKTKQAKSRRKMLERLERVEGVTEERSARFKLRATIRTGDQVLVLDRLQIGFEGRALASNISLTLRRGERLGIIGANGTGKTTLLRTIVGERPKMRGNVIWGSNVNVGYYDQSLATIDERNLVADEIRSLASASVTDGEIRRYLARFLFSGDDVYKPVSVLSGGEKGRLALAKLIYSRANVLVLDEPTNHLDIAAREALEDALNDFDGTILTVSHDRYFLDRIATQILYFGQKDEQIRVEHFNGTYSEFYDEHHRKLALDEPSTKTEVIAPPAPKHQVSRREKAPKKVKRAAVVAPDEVAAKIAVLEGEMQQLSQVLASDEVARDRERLLALAEEYQDMDDRLKTLYSEWESAVAAEAALAEETRPASSA
jgi:ATP-binding cassette subfamily F protein 3